MNKVEKLVSIWKENNLPDNSIYDDEKIKEIAITCLSLSKTWFDNNKPTEKESYGLKIYNSDGSLSETLYGVTPDNLPETIMSLITKSYSKVILYSYIYKNGKNEELNELGTLDIS